MHDHRCDTWNTLVFSLLILAVLAPRDGGAGELSTCIGLRCAHTFLWNSVSDISCVSFILLSPNTVQQLIVSYPSSSFTYLKEEKSLRNSARFSGFRCVLRYALHDWNDSLFFFVNRPFKSVDCGDLQPFRFSSLEPFTFGSHLLEIYSNVRNYTTVNPLQVAQTSPLIYKFDYPESSKIFRSRENLTRPNKWPRFEIKFSSLGLPQHGFPQ